jgi:hypothetical protein|tara:strand:- start:151 stop:267 length:117 start_codon:yes stop_codon:yes gene_type:complete
MKTEIKKSGKGHDIYINGEWVMWVIGSKKNAQKELENL